LGLLQEGANPCNGTAARFSPIAEIEHETRIAERFPAEPGGTEVLGSKEIFNITQ